MRGVEQNPLLLFVCLSSPRTAWRPMSGTELDGQLGALSATARQVEGDSKAFSDDSQAVLRNQR